MEDWQALLAQIEIDGNLYPNIEEELQAFEQAHSRKLPKEYRDYCKVFGGGDFNELIKVFCIAHNEPVEEALLNQLDGRNVLKKIFTEDSFSHQIIDSSFTFAYGMENYDLWFLFDLGSYNPEQEDCDIYMLDLLTATPYRLGRSFYRFICDFCMTETARGQFPDLLCDEDFVYPNTFLCPLA